MADRLSDIIRFRREKLALLARAGIDPYPSSVRRTHTNAEAVTKFNSLKGRRISLAGRIRSLRIMGQIIFAHIEDGSGRIQILLKSDAVGVKAFALFRDQFDIGDFVECTGKLFLTKTKEKTLEVKSFRMLAKSLLPLPGEHYGLEDPELKLRKRYLDLLVNPEVKETFVAKARFWAAVRRFMTAADFLELEMPVLESTPGGAETEPFTTHMSALDRDFYLRISLELPLKKMLVAGFERVFEIGRIFRNEGISSEHLQDYTQLEFYWAYADFDTLMDFSRRLYQYVIKETFGTLSTVSGGRSINWGGRWPKVDYIALFKKHTGIDPSRASLKDLQGYATKHKLDHLRTDGKARLIDLIFKRQIRVLPGVFDQPVFLVNQPVEIEPLAKRDPKNPRVVQRFQILAAGTELGKGFGELNDPIDQRARFEEQMGLRAAGDKEAQMIDEEYIEAMEYGMPPAAGFGLSERLFAVLADKPVRETQIFPLMKAAQAVSRGRRKRA